MSLSDSEVKIVSKFTDPVFAMQFINIVRDRTRWSKVLLLSPQELAVAGSTSQTRERVDVTFARIASSSNKIRRLS